MVGETRKPLYETILYNDPAIAVGAGNWVDAAVIAPMDGYLVAVAVIGAGVEDGEIKDTMGSPIQHIAGSDMAIDVNVYMAHSNPGPEMFACAPFQIINQPCKLNTRYDVQYPNGTGVAEANWYFVFSKTPVADKRYRLRIAAEDTFAAGSIIFECPTQVEGLSMLKALFIRGAGGQDCQVQIGTNGPLTQVPCRAINVDTDQLPFTFWPIHSDGLPDRLIINAFNGFTGVGMIYAVFV